MPVRRDAQGVADTAKSVTRNGTSAIDIRSMIISEGRWRVKPANCLARNIAGPPLACSLQLLNYCCYTHATLRNQVDSDGTGWWRWHRMDISSFPKCQKCREGDLVPLSDFGSQGAAIHFKAWACTNPECGFNIKIRNGDLYIDEPIASGALHSPHAR